MKSMDAEVDYEGEEEGEEVDAKKGASGSSYKGIKVKGRGHNRDDGDKDDYHNSRYAGRGGVFERIEQDKGSGPSQCKNFISKYRILV